MRTHFKSGAFVIWIGLLIFTWTAQASVKPAELVYHQGLITLKPGRFSLLAVLKHLADAAKIEIYITEKFSDSSNQMGFDRVPVHDMLCTLLKGYSFAVLYSKDSNHRGQVYLSSDGSTFHPAEEMVPLKNIGSVSLVNGASATDTAQVTDTTQVREDGPQSTTYLEHKIRKLQEEIESGSADQRYNRWIQIKNPKYVTNPRDELARYQQELNRLKKN